MGPPGARLGHPDSGAAPDLPHRDRKDHVFAAWGAVTIAGEGREYRPETFLPPETVAAVVAQAVAAPPDAHVHEVIVRPR